MRAFYAEMDGMPPGAWDEELLSFWPLAEVGPVSVLLAGCRGIPDNGGNLGIEFVRRRAACNQRILLDANIFQRLDLTLHHRQSGRASYPTNEPGTHPDVLSILRHCIQRAFHSRPTWV
jgi:hypothetical protein